SEGVPDHDGRLVEQVVHGLDQLGVTGGPQRFGRWRGSPEPRQVEGDGVETIQSRREIGTPPTPAVERQHPRGSTAEPLREEGTAGDGEERHRRESYGETCGMRGYCEGTRWPLSTHQPPRRSSLARPR